MNIADRCVRISNSFYNLGLEKAKIRDLSGAVPCLKKALEFNKNNTDARNLLGLIYYETGEVANAIVQWVISMNLNPMPNSAQNYLNEIQKKPGKLETYSQVISKYNQALFHAQNASDDLALLQLTRIVEINKKYIKAHLLLALLYMNDENFVKAGKSLVKVLAIDKSNPKALWYMSIVKENTGKADIEKRKLKNAFSHRQMQDDDVIIPSSYSESTGWQTVLNIGIGLLIGASAMVFLYMPTKVREINNINNKEIISISEKLSSASNAIDTLNESTNTLTDENNRLNSELNTIEENNTYRLSQYQILAGILDAYRTNDFSHAANLYSILDSQQLMDIDDGSGVSVNALYSFISEKMNAEGYVSLSNIGDTAYAAGNYQAAIDSYNKSLNIKPDYTLAMYKIALCYKQLGDLQTANTLLGNIILEYPNTEIANMAQSERGY